MKFKVFAVLLVLSAVAKAKDYAYELGLGAGHTTPMAYDNFTGTAGSGDSNNYFFGYRWSDKWGAELGYDVLDFDRIDMTSKNLSLSGVYHFIPNHKIAPIAKMGLGYAQHSFAASGIDSKSGGMAKLALALEFNMFKYVGLQAGFDYHMFEKISDTVKTPQALNPYIALAIHWGGDEVAEPRQEAVVEKPVAKVAAAISKPDSDGDGIADDEDKCSGTKAGLVVNAYGCAVTEKATISVNVLFAGGKSAIQPATLPEVEKLAAFMKKFPETKVHIKGYTDASGNQNFNTKLSQGRADAVKTELVKAGISADRIQASGFGPADPVADNKTAAGRAANRRVVAEISADVEKKK